MPYMYTLTSIIPASPQQVYEAWLDSLAHSEMTGSEAVMSDEVGAEISAWDGYISGSNLELVPGARIVQSWRTSRFSDEHEDSIVTVTLEEAEGGTLLTLLHSNVPDDQRSYEEGGWESNYFEPMRAYFAVLQEGAEAAAPPPAPRPQRAPRKRGTRAMPPAKPATAGKIKRAAKAEPGPAKPAAKRARGAAKKPAKRTAKKTAKKAAKKTAKRTAKRAAPKKASKRKSGSRKRTRG